MINSHMRKSSSRWASLLWALRTGQ